MLAGCGVAAFLGGLPWGPRGCARGRSPTIFSVRYKFSFSGRVHRCLVSSLDIEDLGMLSLAGLCSAAMGSNSSLCYVSGVSSSGL